MISGGDATRRIGRQILAVLLVGASLVACMSDPGEQVSDSRRIRVVSLVQLVADPESFRGQLVRVKGFGVIEFEYMALMLSEDDANYGVLRNGIWLGLNQEQVRQYREYTGRWLLVEGVFNPDNTGHFGGWSGALEEITRLEPLMSKDELEAIAERQN